MKAYKVTVTIANVEDGEDPIRLAKEMLDLRLSGQLVPSKVDVNKVCNTCYGTTTNKDYCTECAD